MNGEKLLIIEAPSGALENIPNATGARIMPIPITARTANGQRLRAATGVTRSQGRTCRPDASSR